MELSKILNSHPQERFWVLQGQSRDIYLFLLLVQFLLIDVNVTSNQQYMYNLLKAYKGL